jgi:hypothetical protein
MEIFDGFEPQVGDVRAVRTFRIASGGVLYPLFNDAAWSPGINSAVCRHLSPVMQRGENHRVPAPDCTCGFYAYADELLAREYANARDVLAVVSCSGRVIAGTRGLRAQYARIDAIWMSPAVPAELAAMVETNYPDATVVADRNEMLSRFTPSVLDCYEPRAAFTGTSHTRLVRAVLIGALVAGQLPLRWLEVNHAVLVAWLLELCCLLRVMLHRRPSSEDAAGSGRRLIVVAALLWTVSPFAGTAGIFLLKLPLVLIAVFGVLQRRQLTRAARRFPADITTD